MGIHSLLIFEAMKVTLVLFASVAFVLGCPDDLACPAGTHPCHMGIDPATGCPWPDLCIEPQFDANGLECPPVCPCPYDELPCPMADPVDADGCFLPEMCLPLEDECPP